MYIENDLECEKPPATSLCRKSAEALFRVCGDITFYGLWLNGCYISTATPKWSDTTGPFLPFKTTVEDLAWIGRLEKI